VTLFLWSCVGVVLFVVFFCFFFFFFFLLCFFFVFAFFYTVHRWVNLFFGGFRSGAVRSGGARPPLREMRKENKKIRKKKKKKNYVKIKK